MANRTLTLQAELVNRLESIAQERGATVEAVIADLIGEPHLPSDTLQSDTPPAESWAVAVAREMEAFWEAQGTNRVGDPDASVNSRKHFEEHLAKKYDQSAMSENGKAKE